MKSLANISPRISTFRALRLPALTVLAALLVLSGQGLLAAEGPIVAVQETLKNQQFFFGASNGLLDEPTRAALRRFQIRHGLDSTGELDSVTMSALQRPSLPPPAASSVVEKDRQFLAGLQEGGAQGAASSVPQPTAPAPAVVGFEPPAPVGSAPPPKIGLTQVAPPPAPVERSASQVTAAAPVTKVTAATPVTKVTPTHVSLIEADGTAELKASVAGSESLKRKVAVPTNRTLEKPRWEPTPAAILQRVPDRRVLSSETRFVGSDGEDPVEPADIRITRTITTGRDGRTYITERRTTTVSGAPAPIRRAEPVEPRHRMSLFDRIFNND